MSTWIISFTSVSGGKVIDFIALSKMCAPNVSPETMAAIVKTESQFQPLAIGINGGTRLLRQPANKNEAVITSKWLIERGYNIDLGLGQVNSANLVKTGLNVEDAFDPCKNLQAASFILKNSYQRAILKTGDSQSALLAAISAYNTGNFSKGFSNGYVQKVVANANTTLSTVQPIPIIPAVKVHATNIRKTALNHEIKPVQLKPKAQLQLSASEKAEQTPHEAKKSSWDVFNDF
jgi:type IV secretion system protein VirB1